jgi:hypothetical protein
MAVILIIPPQAPPAWTGRLPGMSPSWPTAWSCRCPHRFGLESCHQLSMLATDMEPRISRLERSRFACDVELIIIWPVQAAGFLATARMLSRQNAVRYSVKAHIGQPGRSALSRASPCGHVSGPPRSSRRPRSSTLASHKSPGRYPYPPCRTFAWPDGL